MVSRFITDRTVSTNCRRALTPFTFSLVSRFSEGGANAGDRIAPPVSQLRQRLYWPDHRPGVNCPPGNFVNPRRTSGHTGRIPSPKIREHNRQQYRCRAGLRTGSVYRAIGFEEELLASIRRSENILRRIEPTRR